MAPRIQYPRYATHVHEPGSISLVCVELPISTALCDLVPQARTPWAYFEVKTFHDPWQYSVQLAIYGTSTGAVDTVVAFFYPTCEDETYPLRKKYRVHHTAIAFLCLRSVSTVPWRSQIYRLQRPRPDRHLQAMTLTTFYPAWLALLAIS